QGEGQHQGGRGQGREQRQARRRGQGRPGEGPRARSRGRGQGRREGRQGLLRQVSPLEGGRDPRPPSPPAPQRTKDNVMGFFSFLLLGLIAGAIAKLIIPGKQAGGWFITLLLGVVGAFVGGWLGGLLFDANLQEFFSLQTWLLAIGGSLVVLLIYGLITGRRSAK